ncbi:hypothetical protein HNQ91_002518 [Filimonas zeae]|uniref:Beta-glycosidase n=1 Tax=Filimonas zeae TaxID=1737353 RepID=A0A917IW89_9BACT|nr:sugar-binding domain-containing protein [Filimonas zeae]MDR6339467.1 hypothetical protein [Filimonas zeae]GGH63481.1 hypothetical protein GCM10011379_14430 [Filimonas zeae]
MKISFRLLMPLLAVVLSVKGVQAQSGRTVMDLSGNNWMLWLDTAARWQNDQLYTPPVNIKSLPVNIPTGGWAALAAKQARTVHLPATVEQFYWGSNGNAFGVSGNYLGVSWFSTKVAVPTAFKSKRVVLKFESVRFRAEVFVNRKLVGYDLVNSTPFEVDITNAVVPGTLNDITVRITDPNGNFDWRDSQNFMWGEYRTQPTHGFGGITGKVWLQATDAVFVSDVFVKNKPEPREVEFEITADNTGTTTVNGTYEISVADAKTGQVVFTQTKAASLAAGATTIAVAAKVLAAKLWDVEHPNLYQVRVQWKGANGTADVYRQRFGFRWFEIKDVNGDRQFYLNNKRIVLRTSISWGFWPVNGMMPSDELAYKQVAAAKRLGLNMLNFHRTIGQTNVLNAADELGLLYFEEPGGNQYPESLFTPKNEAEVKQTNYYLAVRSEKLFRMIRRDRSHPSLVIYNMHNERGAQPHAQDNIEMQAAHRLDPTRILTYNSSNGGIKMNEPDPRFKRHLLPNDTTFYDYGWFDQHHAGGPGVYHDNVYASPDRYIKYTDKKDEIVYWGEEGAIGTPPRLQLIRNEILKTGVNIGWETDAYLKWYDAYDRFLKGQGFSKAFPNVDSLTRKMGNVAYYYQGRVIENVRINNINDGYAVNGWESMKLENHSGVVDNYRNLKGDAELIARYNQPLYVAVKVNHKVVPAGNTVMADFYLVNEKDVKGEAELRITAFAPDNTVCFTKTMNVTAAGGVTYGQLLVSGITIPVNNAGYTNIKALLYQQQKQVAEGDDQVYAVQLNKTQVSDQLVVADTSGVLQNYFKSINQPYTNYEGGRPTGKVMVAAAIPLPQGNPLVTDILEWVNNGNTLVVAGNADYWAAFLAKKEVIEMRGIQTLGTTWYGGNFFVKEHALFAGLPQSCVFNWEYQCFAAYNKSRTGMRMFNGETVVACVSDHKQEVYAALSVIPHGRGKIILSTLDFISCIAGVKEKKRAEGDGENAAMNTFNAQVGNPANVVGQQLLLNMLKGNE